MYLLMFHNSFRSCSCVFFILKIILARELVFVNIFIFSVHICDCALSNLTIILMSE